MVTKALVELVDDETTMQSLQLSGLADVVRDKVERLQQYGFSSVPEPGAEAIVLHVGGNASNPVVIVVDDPRYRPTGLAEGESCMYTLANGVRVLCKADGEIHIGTEPEEYAARADRVDARLDALEEAHNDHTHSIVFGACTAGGTTGTASSAGPSATSSGESTACDEVKIK